MAGFLPNGAPDTSGHGRRQPRPDERRHHRAGLVQPLAHAPGHASAATPTWRRTRSSAAIALGTIESFDCNPSGGPVPEPQDATNIPAPAKNADKRPPCFVAPPSLYNGKLFTIPQKGVAPKKDRPGFREGSNGTAVDPHPGDPLH